MTNPNCTEFEARLNEAVENRQLLTGDRFDALAARCDHCRDLLAEQRRLDHAVAVWNRAGIGEVDLADRVLAKAAFDRERLATSRNPQLRTRKSALAVAIAVAATLAFVLTLSWWRRPADDAIGPALAVETQPPANLPREPIVRDSVVDEPPTEFVSLVKDAGAGYLTLARDAAVRVADVQVLVPRTASRNTTPEIGADGDVKRFARELNEGLKPLGNDLGKAFRFLREAVPETPAML